MCTNYKNIRIKGLYMVITPFLGQKTGVNAPKLPTFTFKMPEKI